MSRTAHDTAVTATVLGRGAADARGASFVVAAEQLEFLGAPGDIHVASLLPGHIRGNHFHELRNELIIVIHEDRWSLRSDRGAGTKIASRAFTGAGVVAITVPKGSAHAIRNDGERAIWLLAASDGPYDAGAPDAHPRVLIDP
jgi:dTDP-4-dehydrorhamnose 3,5-epimerase-like enzyme